MLWGDHYAILGVTPTASDEEIEAAYGHLCRRYHPDLNPGDPQALAAYERIESAYEILRDSERRRHYDRRGHRPLPSAPPPAARLTTQTEAEHENGS
ncbi:MAG: J domain-containing protein, partial [Acidobacteriota bacterium]